MTEPVTYRLGPIIVRIGGDELVTRWAARTFDVLACSDEPDLEFRFVDEPVHPCAGGVGDDRMRVAEQALSFQTRHYDVCVCRAKRLTVNLRVRDRRPLWLRSLSDPEETWKVWLTHGETLDVHRLKEFAYSISPLALQCAMLERGAALIHASAFAVGDRAVLLPAWGGVGKSTMVSRAVLHGSAHFIADDHAVIDRQGQTHLYTLPIHLYAYHLASDSLLKQRALSGCTNGSRRQWPIGARLRRKRAVRWVRPQDLFTPQKLAQQARIEQAVVMFRSDIDEFDWRDCSAEEAARPCVGVILREISGFAERLAGAEAGLSGSPLPALGESHRLLSEVYAEAFSESACARLMVPRGASIDDLVSFMKQRCPLVGEALQDARAAQTA